MNAKTHDIDWDKTMKKTMVLSPKITLVIKLQTLAANVYDSYGIYADTESTLDVDQV